MKTNIEHTGFCLGEYDPEDCKDCPSLKECLDLYAEENKLEVDERDPDNYKVGC